MTLEEAIKNFEQEIGEFEGLKKIQAVTYEDYEYIEKTRQLVEWLRELQERRKQPEIVRCGACKHNPKLEWFGCPASHLSEKQKSDNAWCWRG